MIYSTYSSASSPWWYQEDHRIDIPPFTSRIRLEVQGVFEVFDSNPSRWILLFIIDVSSIRLPPTSRRDSPSRSRGLCFDHLLCQVNSSHHNKRERWKRNCHEKSENRRDKTIKISRSNLLPPYEAKAQTFVGHNSKQEVLSDTGSCCELVIELLSPRLLSGNGMECGGRRAFLNWYRFEATGPISDPHYWDDVEIIVMLLSFKWTTTNEQAPSLYIVGELMAICLDRSIHDFQTIICTYIMMNNGRTVITFVRVIFYATGSEPSFHPFPIFLISNETGMVISADGTMRADGWALPASVWCVFLSLLPVPCISYWFSGFVELYIASFLDTFINITRRSSCSNPNNQ